MGVGTILGGYLVGRELFGRVGGLSAAFLFAFSRWDINLSRIGMYNISTPLFALLTAPFSCAGSAVVAWPILAWPVSAWAWG